MSQTGGLRKAVDGRAGENNVHRIVQADPMTDGDVHRPDAGAGSKDCPDNFVGVDERDAASTGDGGGAVATAQPGFSAADGRDIQDEPQVAREAETTGMGDSLAIDDQCVRQCAQALYCSQGDRRLTKTQQAGNIREVHREFGSCLANRVQPGKIQNNRPGPDYMTVYVNIHSRNGSYPAPEALADYPCGQSGLKRSGFPGR